MNGALTDAELTRGAQAGDPACLGLLLERHRASMQVVALSLLGYSPETPDAVQDAMLVALRRIGELRDPNAAGAWLRTLTRNACLMRLRTSQREIVDEESLLALPADTLSPEQALDHHALRNWIWRALEELSEPLQAVVLLRYFSGVSTYSQIAALLDVPVGTVRSRLNEAKRRLGAALLTTASASHDDVALFTSRRRREIADLFAAAKQGQVSRTLADMWAPDLELFGPQGQTSRSREALMRIMESDLEAGVRQRVVEVTASQRFTIIESDLLSPPWDPNHCPTGVVWLLTLHDHRVERVRLFHPQPTPVAP
jgi:RNA polymerase sigma-70 factor (ECF subfamily)